MRTAFYAPIKPPDHPIPSGDRLIAGNVMEALSRAGFGPFLASRFIAYSKRAEADILQKRKAKALAEAEQLVAELRDDPPDLWFTYHPYCKAPDWIGPQVAQSLNIPYVTAEAARTGQGFENGGDAWKDWREEAQAGIRSADLHLALKPSDREYLAELLGGRERLAEFPPFIDTRIPDPLPAIERPSHWRDDVPEILTVGMMRPGKKFENFRILAAALRPLQPLPWNLTLIGGGPQEEAVQDIFSDFASERLNFTGGISREEVLCHMARADLFCWPGWREPIGMVYLEAQMLGLPVVAMADMGVPLVVEHGKTGLLAEVTDPGADPSSLTTHLEAMLSHPDLRRDFAAAGPERVADHHSLDSAARRLANLLSPLVSKG